MALRKESLNLTLLISTVTAIKKNAYMTGAVTNETGRNPKFTL